MSFKFKSNLSAIKDLKLAVEDIKQEFVKTSSEKVLDIIVNTHIKKGISPVEGVGRYEKYSKSYREAIKAGRYSEYSKKTSPVNLTLSGKMLDSFKVVPTAKGIGITVSDKKFDYHNFLGAGKSHVVRPMLPVSSEALTPLATKKILDLLVKVIDKIIAKFK